MTPTSFGTSSDPALSRCIANLETLGFQVLVDTQTARWIVRMPDRRHVAHLDQRALKCLARACRYFLPRHQ